MRKPIRVGIVGMGFGQRVHEPSFNSNTRFKVTQIGKNWKAMIEDPSIDVISVAVPPHAQGIIATQALKNGKHVFCEKPMSALYKEASQMAQIAKKSGLANMIDFELTKIEEWSKAKKLIQEQGIGRVKHLEVAWNIEIPHAKKNKKSWKTDSKLGGGVLYLFGSHVFYYLEYFLGKIKKVLAINISDNFAAFVVEFKNKATATVFLSNQSVSGNSHCLKFYGDRGVIDLSSQSKDYARGFVLKCRQFSSPTDLVLSNNKNSKSYDGRIDLVAKLTHDLADWIDNNNPQKPDFQDGLRVQHLIECTKKSYQNKKWKKTDG